MNTRNEPGNRPTISARDRLLTSSPSDPDSVVALRLATYLLEIPGRNGRYYPFILLESSRSPCSVPFTHKRKNARFFATTDREAAIDWIVKASTRGFAVQRSFSLNGMGGGMGTLAEIRERACDYAKRGFI